MTTLDERLEAYKTDGFTIFERVFDEVQMQLWKDKHRELSAANNGQTWFGNTLELAPDLMWSTVANPMILEFVEKVMGPFVQLDNLTLAAFPSIEPEKAEDRVSGWHRDRWAHVPFTDAYHRPNAVNAISYLQDLTDEFGPLRVIIGSHRRPLTIEDADRGKPHPDEKLIRMKAGDVVITHNGLVHSGTPNTSGQLRYFFSIYYNLTWLKHTDHHTGTNTQKLLAEAKALNNHQHMRLLGVDEQLQPRCNSGFLQSDEERWEAWAAADRAAIKEE
ncbi:phytanoyl-CoA dioxygenase family protein [Candidatus Poribacteria bacterium]|nr:phytanoyl-CoA dioxygenase family protein [Candidatus Poribacteria bacterium]MYB63414.1 phytanoyl-CoA dioxygenase family protein [Candidatus Poribacteria bacterium]MYF56245.1 phytanoyl-CoA dioxygenase family protein [Candidatus Poribacteria bacterium]MYI94634.1 phytanoyl-CoA dioxygenase family protein [Candidatus Poribacteria bacterium]